MTRLFICGLLTHAMELTNSKRQLLSASYVATELTPAERERLSGTEGRALDKVNYLRALNPTITELARMEEAIRQESRPEIRDELLQVARLARGMASERPALQFDLASQFARVPERALTAFAGITADIRKDEATKYVAAAFDRKLRIAPVGRIHLERIEMYPVGMEKGELVFTVPLSPKETVTISHKEWSLSGEEYERIVQDYFESYSEKGVAEKSDYSLSSENESRHSKALSFSASLSSGFGPVSVTTSFGLNATSENRQAVKESIQRNQEITQKASARTRKEHKVSVKLETKRGVEDSSFRTISNPHEDRALRIDYFRMMRKWKTDLFRYGLRLTFDVVIPNPGARLWARYREVEEYDRLMRQPFVFDLKVQDLKDDTEAQKAAAAHNAVIEPMPKSQKLTVWRDINHKDGGMEAVEFLAPPGYRLGSEVAAAGTYYNFYGSPYLVTQDQNATYQGTGTTGNGQFKMNTSSVGGDDKRYVFLFQGAGTRFMIALVTEAIPAEATVAAWRSKTWTVIRDTALSAWNARRAQLAEQRDRLWNQLTGKDTLTLRRLEREELVRQTMSWLIGPDFESSPYFISQTIKKIVDFEEQNLPDLPGMMDLQFLDDKEWGRALAFGEYVKFIHQAVEWENLLYFLYPYFWGSDDLARQKMLFEHVDPTHKEFLRAGYARVVIPIRPGFEKDFTRLLETGDFGSQGPINSPYMTIAEEVAAFARTNYAGIPPANPEKHARSLLYPQQRTTWASMEKVLLLLEKHLETTKSYPDNLASFPGAPFLDAWGNALVYTKPGSGNDFDLISYGADGAEGGEGIDADISAAAGASLMATWFEYTPTSGIDIEINEKYDALA